MGTPPLPAPRIAFGALVLLASSAAADSGEEPSDAPPPRVSAHALDLVLDPVTGGLRGSDRMTVRRERGGGDLALDLRDGLRITLAEVDGRPLDAVARRPEPAAPGVARYLVPLPGGAGEGSVTIAWEGTLREEVRAEGGLAFVAGDRVTATISPAGVYLASGGAWHPSTGDMAAYSVRARVPAGWSVATQGGVPTTDADAEGATFVFPAAVPSDGLWLQAGRWIVERREGPGGVSIGTYLSERNAAHGQVLADAVAAYLPLYASLLGPFPHGKFDVVENFFTTGYGMPTATLLGGDVIARIGMVAGSSGGKVPPGYLDHELVHCWWGNGVFVDHASGNWCEALTTYCSNYLRREWDSPAEAADHRRTTRARFASRVNAAKDYPLRRFTGKTEDFENDIGYGKGSMLFHAVRRAVGDEPFFAALRDVVKEFTGRRAGWDDLRAAFEARGKRRLDALFDAFLDRPGAPVPRLADLLVVRDEGGWTVSGSVVQDGDPWPLSVPLVIETGGGEAPLTVEAGGARSGFSVHLAHPPLRVLLDPDSHCWRGFAPGELPASMDATLNDPAGVDVHVRAAAAGGVFASVVEALRERGATVCTVADDGSSVTPPPAAPGAKSVVILDSLRPPEAGARDAVADLLGLLPGGVRVDGARLTVGDRRFEGDDVALLATLRHPATPERALTLYAGMSDGALAAARRVFYYGADGLVVFKAGRPVLRLPAEGDGSSRVPLLPGLLPEPSAERVELLLAALAAMDGRLAGSPAGKESQDFLASLLEDDDGHRVVRQRVEFEVSDWDGSACTSAGEAPMAGGVPFCFSPAVAEWQAVVPEPPFRVDGSTTPERFLTEVQRRLESRPGPVLVIGPPAPPPTLADYLLFPSAAPEREGPGPHPDPAIAVEGRRARLLLPDFPVTAPVVYFGTEPERSALPARVRAPLILRRVATENLFAVLDGSEPALRGEAILLGAHHDALGPGFPGIDDDASGVAAVREAGRALAARPGALGRSVVLALFGAEEWGLRGSRAFAAAPPPDLPRIVAALTLDTVGDRAKGGVDVVGRTVHPGLAAVADRCLAAEGFRTGRDIDRHAFAWGSDHYALHVAGIPAVDLFSGDYARMHAPGETGDHVDAAKVVRIARAAAAFAMTLSRGEVKR